MSDQLGDEDPQWGPGQVVQRRHTGYYHHVVNRYRDVDDGHIIYRIASPTHTGYEFVREEDAVFEYETAGFRIPVGLKPASVFGHRVDGILYGYNERPHEPVTDGGVDQPDGGVDRCRGCGKALGAGYVCDDCNALIAVLHRSAGADSKRLARMRKRQHESMCDGGGAYHEDSGTEGTTHE